MSQTRILLDGRCTMHVGDRIKVLGDLVSQDPSLVSSAYERSSSFVCSYPTFDGLQAGSSSSSVGCISVSGPARRQESHGLSAVADTMEMVGVVHHQLDRLVPNLIGHVVTSGIQSTGLTLRETNRSADLVPGSKHRLGVALTLIVNKVSGFGRSGSECLSGFIRLAFAVKHQHQRPQRRVVLFTVLGRPVTHQAVNRFGHAPDHKRLVRHFVLNDQWFRPIHLLSPLRRSAAWYPRPQQRRAGLVPLEVIG